MKLKSKKNIQTLGKQLEVYPSLDALFTEEQRWLTAHFVPLISIDLAVLNKEWAGRLIRLWGDYYFINLQTKQGSIVDSDC